MAKAVPPSLSYKRRGVMCSQTSEAEAVGTDASVDCVILQRALVTPPVSHQTLVCSFTAVTLNILNKWFFAKSEHIHKARGHLRTKPVQEKACFYFGTTAWSKRVQIPGLSQLEPVYGRGLKHRLS